MNAKKRGFDDLSFQEKLTVIDERIDSVKLTNDFALDDETREWLRQHIPAYDSGKGENYVFVSYAHKDFKCVYSDLAFFSYNTNKKVRFWYDEGLRAGEDWFIEARKHMSQPNCVGVIFYLSENLLRSKSVFKEIELVKELEKPYFTVTLSDNKFCAADYLDKKEDAELLEKVGNVFPKKDTTLAYKVKTDKDHEGDENLVVYDDEYDSMYYRVNKIEQAFAVTEPVFSSFKFDEVEDGLSLISYIGEERTVFIPDFVERKPVVEIKCAFGGVSEIYVPKTVKRILPVEDLLFECAKIRHRLDYEMIFQTESMAAIEKTGRGPDRVCPRAIFGGADDLGSINVAEGNEFYFDRNGILYDKKGALLRYPPACPWSNQAFEGVKRIGEGAFFNSKSEYIPGIMKLDEPPPTIPSSVEEIGDYAFASASHWFIEISEGVKRIGKGAFADFSCHHFLTLPESVEYIGEGAFRGCNVKLIVIRSHIDTIPHGAFFGFWGEEIKIRTNEIKNIEDMAFAFCPNLVNFDLPEVLKTIGYGAFMYCKKLMRLTIPSSLEKVSDMAFYGCESLKDITISEGVQEIGNGAFHGCKKVKKIVLPRSVRCVNRSCFDNCESLQYVMYSGDDFDQFAEDSHLYDDLFSAVKEGVGPEQFARGDHLFSKIITKKQLLARLWFDVIIKISDFFDKYKTNEKDN